MEQEKIKQEQTSALNNFAIRQKELEIKLIKQNADVRIERLKREIQYLKDN